MLTLTLLANRVRCSSSSHAAASLAPRSVSMVYICRLVSKNFAGKILIGVRSDLLCPLHRRPHRKISSTTEIHMYRLISNFVCDQECRTGRRYIYNNTHYSGNIIKNHVVTGRHSFSVSSNDFQFIPAKSNVRHTESRKKKTKEKRKDLCLSTSPNFRPRKFEILCMEISELEFYLRT